LGVGKKALLCLSLFIALQAGSPVTPAKAQGGIRGKHASEGLQCVDCHKVDKPVAAASVELCLECHGSYEKVAALTKSLHANPHDSHLGKMQCLKCHRVHSPSEILCVECHSDFDFKEK
jgi:hypothetical protein